MKITESIFTYYGLHNMFDDVEKIRVQLEQDKRMKHSRIGAKGIPATSMSDDLYCKRRGAMLSRIKELSK